MQEFIQQIKAFWAQLTQPQRWSILAALAGVVLGLAALLVWSSRPQMKLLYGRLSAEDMADVVEQLNQEETPYELRNNGTAIYVEPQRVHEVRMALASEGIPNGGGVGFEIFDKGNFGVSDFVQRTNYLRAVQGELSRTIAQLKGVDSARVMIVVPENRLLINKAEKRATASVFVDTGGGSLDGSAINSIRFLVANAVEGLALNDVAVVDNHGTVLSEQVRTDGMMGVASSHLKLRKELEDYYTQELESMLTRVVGPGNVVARVSVDIETEASTLVEETFDPDGQVVRQQTSSSNNSSSTESRPQKVAGVASNVVDEAGSSAPESLSNTEDTETEKSVTYEINRSTRETVKRPGDIRRISAAVFVALRFQPNEDGLIEPKPRTEEEMNQLRQVVFNSLGIVAGDSRASELVTLSEVAFPDPENEPGVMGVDGPVFRWIEIARNFIAVGVAVVIFVVFLRMLKKHRFENFGIELLGEDEKSGEAEEANKPAPAPTPELLNELIRQKPDNVSTALKNWLGSNAHK